MEKVLILDYSKWRCGHTGDYKLGDGDTALLNKEGFMCCLGQFASQLKSDITEEKLLGNGNPADLDEIIPLLSEQLEDEENDDFGVIDTRLTEEAIEINDDLNTNPEQKIHLLQKLFSKLDYKIEVINKH